MRYRNEIFVVLAAILAATARVSGQAPAADAAAKKTLTDAANALGMVRGVARALDVVNMIEYTASGTKAAANGGTEYKVRRITAGYDYVIPAARVDVETIASDGSVGRTIEVASGNLSWDESTPGIYLRPGATSAAARLQQIWLLPHGLILAGAKALDQVKTADRGGMTELSVSLPDGMELRGLLGEKNLLAHVEFKTAEQVWSGDYSDYMDFHGYGVMFPSHIVQKVDGRTVADLAVTDALANPYLIFPPPKALVQKPAP
jgi:hypothetical protein